MQWLCRSTSTPPLGPQPGTRNGHEHHELETQEPFAAAPPPPRLPRQVRSRRRRARVHPPTVPPAAVKRRAGMSSRMILGTSITCSATRHSVSKKRRTSTSWSPISGTGTSRIGSAGAVSTIWSTGYTVVVVERKVLCAGLLGRSASGTSPCTSSRTPHLALAFFCPRRLRGELTRQGTLRRSDARAVATV